MFNHSLKICNHSLKLAIMDLKTVQSFITTLNHAWPRKMCNHSLKLAIIAKKMYNHSLKPAIMATKISQVSCKILLFCTWIPVWWSFFGIYSMMAHEWLVWWIMMAHEWLVVFSVTVRVWTVTRRRGCVQPTPGTSSTIKTYQRIRVEGQTSAMRRLFAPGRQRKEEPSVFVKFSN